MHPIVSICGTSRPQSFTRKALAVVNGALREKGVEPTVFEAENLTLNFPGHEETSDAKALKEAVSGASGIVLATPEYHGSFCAMTKLIIENLGFPSVLSGKPVALLGVAAGRIGAIKALEQLKGVCSHVGALVVPGAISIAGIHNAFEQDQVVDASSEKALNRVADSLLQFIHEYVYPKRALEEMVRSEENPWSSTV